MPRRVTVVRVLRALAPWLLIAVMFGSLLRFILDGSLWDLAATFACAGILETWRPE